MQQNHVGSNFPVTQMRYFLREGNGKLKRIKCIGFISRAVGRRSLVQTRHGLRLPKVRAARKVWNPIFSIFLQGLNQSHSSVRRTTCLMPATALKFSWLELVHE